MGRKIGIAGATGNYDFGDYAMLVSNIQELYKRVPECEFIIFTISETITRELLLENILDKELLSRIEIVDDTLLCGWGTNRIVAKIIEYLGKYDCLYKNLYKSVKKGIETKIDIRFLKALSEIDILIFNGGGYLQFSWTYHNIRFMIEILLAKKRNKKVYFLSNSIGPMGNYEKYVRKTLPLVDKIMIRDGENYSKKFLKDFGMSQLVNGPDDLFCAAQKYFMEGLDKTEYIVVELMMWLDKAQQGVDYIINCLVGFIDYVIQIEKKKVLLMNLYRGEKQTLEYICQICRTVKDKNKIHICAGNQNIYQVFEYYRNCSFSLSFRYHPIILALGNKRPCIGIITDNTGYYEGKINGAFQNCNLPAEEYVLRINDVTKEELIASYKKAKDMKIDNSIWDRLHTTWKEYVDTISSELNGQGSYNT